MFATMKPALKPNPVAGAVNKALKRDLSRRIGRTNPPGTHTKPIEDICVGDLVWAWDENLRSLVRRPVARLFRHQSKPIIVVTMVNGDGAEQCIEATTEHPFWVESKGWVAACKLQKGDLLRRIDGGACLRVASAQLTRTCADVFNFEVDSAHNYFVGHMGVLVHNESMEASPAADATPIRPGRQIGDGVSGRVHEIDGHPTRVVKIPLDSSAELRLSTEVENTAIAKQLGLPTLQIDGFSPVEGSAYRGLIIEKVIGAVSSKDIQTALHIDALKSGRENRFAPSETVAKKFSQLKPELSPKLRAIKETMITKGIAIDDAQWLFGTNASTGEPTVPFNDLGHISFAGHDPGTIELIDSFIAMTEMNMPNGVAPAPRGSSSIVPKVATPVIRIIDDGASASARATTGIWAKNGRAYAWDASAMRTGAEPSLALYAPKGLSADMAMGVREQAYTRFAAETNSWPHPAWRHLPGYAPAGQGGASFAGVSQIIDAHVARGGLIHFNLTGMSELETVQARFQSGDSVATKFTEKELSHVLASPELYGSTVFYRDGRILSAAQLGEFGLALPAIPQGGLALPRLPYIPGLGHGIF